MAVPKLCAIAVLLASAVAVRQIAKTDAEGTHLALVREHEHVAQNTTQAKHTRWCCMCETNFFGFCKSGTGTQTNRCGNGCERDWDGAKCWHVSHDDAGNDNCHV
ncbi:unnamed protein product [Symbiodinium sp. CCMP2456]|nr:unnamed protein product [Symbiodinium sp. CCMP2456]